MAELGDLWPVADAALDQVGPGCLVPESIRFDTYEGWQVAPLPRYDIDGRIEGRRRRTGAPQTRDRRAIVRALVDAVAERLCSDMRDALLLLDVFAGVHPLGLDAVCHRVLSHDLRQGLNTDMETLHQALERCAPVGISAVCHRESAVGSRKSKGDPATDNEDASGAARGASGTVRCAVFDGVTGAGDGSGGLASQAALDQIGRVWRLDEDLPTDALIGELDAAVGRATERGSAAAVLATVHLDGQASVVSAGDAVAWLIRPLAEAEEPRYAAWRLTPEHTVYAEKLRATASAEGDESSLVAFLGNGPNRWFQTSFSLAPGDLLLLASDGAVEPERDRWFGTVLTELATRLAESGRPLGPALAAALVQRAEALGGWDNATALVCAIGEANDK